MLGQVVRKLIIGLKIDEFLPKLVKGKSKTSFICKFIPDNSLYSQPTIRTVMRNGIRFKLDLSDHMQWLVYFGHNVENRKELYELSKNRKVIIDVGANIGETALNMAKQGANVTAIEANPETYKLLLHNIDLNKELKVGALNVGVADKSGYMYVHRRTARNKGADQLRNNKLENKSAAKVKIGTIDELVKASKIPSNVDCIKVDVEGMELTVLKGAISLIRKMKPAIFLEYSPDNFSDYGYTGGDLISFLLELNYNIYPVGQKREVTDADEIQNHTDIIAI